VPQPPPSLLPPAPPPPAAAPGAATDGVAGIERAPPARHVAASAIHHRHHRGRPRRRGQPVPQPPPSQLPPAPLPARPAPSTSTSNAAASSAGCRHPRRQTEPPTASLRPWPPTRPAPPPGVRPRRDGDAEASAPSAPHEFLSAQWVAAAHRSRHGKARGRGVRGTHIAAAASGAAVAAMAAVLSRKAMLATSGENQASVWGKPPDRGDTTPGMSRGRVVNSHATPP